MTSDLMLVTGGTSFVGAEIARQLREGGYDTRVMVRDRSRAKELEGLGCEIVEGDLTNMESLKKAVNGASGVFHIAALFRQAKHSDSVYYDVNVEGTRRMLDASIEAGVKRFIHCSTGGVLGHVAKPPGSDESPYNPGDIYQVTKMEGEKLALEYFRNNRIQGVVIRPAMIFGPGDTRNLKLFKMIAKRLFFYVGKGDMSVHFVDVRDLARAFILAMEKTELNGGIYHIAGEKPYKLREMVSLVCKKLGVSEPWLHLPVVPMQLVGSLCELICLPFGIQPPIYKRRVDFFTKNRHFDNSKAIRELGFRPEKSFSEEIDEVLAWYKAKNLL